MERGCGQTMGDEGHANQRLSLAQFGKTRGGKAKVPYLDLRAVAREKTGHCDGCPMRSFGTSMSTIAAVSHTVVRLFGFRNRSSCPGKHALFCVLWSGIMDAQKNTTTESTVPLRVKSVGSRSTLRLVEIIEEHQEELRQHLNSKFRDIQFAWIRVERQPAFSIGLDAIAVAFVLGVVGGAGKTVGAKIAAGVMDWIDSTYHDVDIIQLNLSQEENTKPTE